jgi:uncharacterized protein (TIGR02271 family)
MTVFLTLGAIFGGMIGWLSGYSQWTTFGPLMETLIGLLVGAIIGGIIGKYPENRNKTETHTLLLKKEELEISKHKIKTGEVQVYKEIIEEQKIITVPINHEELVIEKFEVHGDLKEMKEVIRIPLSKEEIVVTKQPVRFAEVSISQKNVTEMKQICETLKKEEAHYEVVGLADVQNNEPIEESPR